MNEATSTALVIQYPMLVTGFAIYGVLSAIVTLILIGRMTKREKRIKGIK